MCVCVRACFFHGFRLSLQTIATFVSQGDLCAGFKPLTEGLHAYLAWAVTLDTDWSGMVFLTPSTTSSGNCSTSYQLMVHYAYQGVNTSAAFQASYAHVPLNSAPSYADAWAYARSQDREVIIPVPWTPFGVWLLCHFLNPYLS